MLSSSPHWMQKNAIAAIPSPTDDPLPVSRIYHRQRKSPRLTTVKLRELLEDLSARGEVETLRIGRFSYYRKTGKPLALHEVAAYNGDKRKSFSLDVNVDWFTQVLYPLRVGSTVFLWYEDSKVVVRKNFRGKTRTLLILTPLEGHGFPRGSICVALIGSGSCVVRSDSPSNVANLVLAGMSAALAKTLMNQLHLLFKE